MKVMRWFLGLFVSATPLEFIVKSCVLNPDRMQCVPPITFLPERPAALHTAEALRVPVLIQSGDHFLNDKKNERSNGVRWAGAIEPIASSEASLTFKMGLLHCAQ